MVPPTVRTSRTRNLYRWVLVFAATSAFHIVGCNPTPPPRADADKAIDALALELLQTTPELGNVFRVTSEPAPSQMTVEVYIDHSASMAGYVDPGHQAALPPAGKKNKVSASVVPVALPGSSFTSLLRSLANEAEVTGYFAFGEDNTTTQTVTPLGRTPPLDARQYVRLNNDYAALIKQFAVQTAATGPIPVHRMIITDGVQSHRDKGAGSALGQTVEQLHAWIAGGGAVHLRLLSAPYRGTYYSEELRALNRPYSYAAFATQRPFLVLSLLARRGDLPAWKAFWGRDQFSDLQTLAELSYPEEKVNSSGLSIAPEEKLLDFQNYSLLSAQVWDPTRIHTLNGYRDIWRAQVKRIETPTDPHPAAFPAAFLLSGLKAPATADADLRAMNPVLEIWQRKLLPSTPLAPLTPAPQSALNGSTTPRPDAPWQKQETIDLRDFKNGKVTIESVSTPAPGFRFTCKALPVPEQDNAAAVVLKLQPRATPAATPDWKRFSILDDSNPATLDRIYNLQPFVEQLSSKQTSDPLPVGTAVIIYR
jgi:hypothetical protein